MEGKNKNRRPLVVLKEIYNLVLKEIDQNYTLFGHKNALKDDENNYDLIFHAIPNIPEDSLEKISLVVPVFPENSEEENEVKTYELAKKYPWLEMVAFEDKHLYTVTSLKGKRIMPRSLRFFDVNTTSIGTQLKDIGKYDIVAEKDLASLYSDPEEFLDKFRRCREIIDKGYNKIENQKADQNQPEKY